jgi:hypothetical protein
MGLPTIGIACVLLLLDACPAAMHDTATTVTTPAAVQPPCPSSLPLPLIVRIFAS